MKKPTGAVKAQMRPGMGGKLKAPLKSNKGGKRAKSIEDSYGNLPIR